MAPARYTHFKGNCGCERVAPQLALLCWSSAYQETSSGPLSRPRFLRIFAFAIYILPLLCLAREVSRLLLHGGTLIRESLRGGLQHTRTHPLYLYGWFSLVRSSIPDGTNQPRHVKVVRQLTNNAVCCSKYQYYVYVYTLVILCSTYPNKIIIMRGEKIISIRCYQPTIISASYFCYLR